MPAFPPEAFAEVFSGPELPTVIGGQAVYHWAERFFDKAPELASFVPFVSKDGDLWATRNTAIALRDRTGWHCKLFDEPRTHAVAILTKEVPGHDPLRIEVLKDVHGLRPADLEFSTVITTCLLYTSALAQPSLSVFDNSGNVIASNTGWGTNANPAQIASAAASVGAFALASGSADSALIVNLSAGAYTMQISGVNLSLIHISLLLQSPGCRPMRRTSRFRPEIPLMPWR